MENVIFSILVCGCCDCYLRKGSGREEWDSWVWVGLFSYNLLELIIGDLKMKC